MFVPCSASVTNTTGLTPCNTQYVRNVQRECHEQTGFLTQELNGQRDQLSEVVAQLQTRELLLQRANEQLQEARAQLRGGGGEGERGRLHAQGRDEGACDDVWRCASCRVLQCVGMCCKYCRMLQCVEVRKDKEKVCVRMRV